MKNLKISLLILLSSSTAFSSSFTEIRSSIKAYDFLGAETKMNEYLSSEISVLDPEIYILKFINEIGSAFETDAPLYLINNFNAVESRAYNAFDLSGNGVELTDVPLTVDSQVVGSWFFPTIGNFPIYKDYPDDNRANSIFDWTIETEIRDPFSKTDMDMFYYGSTYNQCISFKLRSDSPTGQQMFFIDLSNADGRGLEIFVNGQDVGYVDKYQYYFWDISNANQYYGDSSPSTVLLPFYLSPGDVVSFALRHWSNEGNRIGVFTPSVNFEKAENGKIYYNYTPDVGENVSVGDVLSFLLKGDAPARSLISALISALDSFINTVGNETVSIGYEFTGYNSDILIQKSDAIALKSFLEIIDVFAGIMNQYDLGIDIDDSILEDSDEMYNTAKEFLNAYTAILTHKNTSENITDQSESKNKITTAFTNIQSALQTLWFRGVPNDPTDIYLIEASTSSDNAEYQKAMNQIDYLKNALNGYETTSNITGETDGGASVSLAPFLNPSAPLDIRQLAIDLSDSTESENNTILNAYGFIKDYLPEDFDGKILVFYNSNNQPNSSIVLNKGDNYGVDPIDGELQIYDFSYYGDSSIDFRDLDITYSSDYSGEWNSDGYYNYNTGNQISPLSGTFYFYDSLLDLNQNGSPDVIDLNNSSSNSDTMYNDFIYTNLIYQSELSSSTIENSQAARQPTPQSLKGFISLQEDEEYDMSTGQNVTEIEAEYFISNDDVFEIDVDEMMGIRDLDLETYEIDGDIITFTETLNDMYGSQTDSSQFFFHDQYSYTKMDLESNNDMMGGENNSLDIDYGVIYPAYLDLDNDGLADGDGMKAQITPKFDRLPTSSEIQTAVESYNQNNDTNDDSGGEQTPPESTQNLNALTDTDGDNMPDALELQYGGNASDPNDATITLNEILSVARYTLSEITDLRLGSTLYEISQGVVSFNIILEESTDLTNWTPHEPMEISLGEQSDDNTKFYRFKMND